MFLSGYGCRRPARAHPPQVLPGGTTRNKTIPINECPSQCRRHGTRDERRQTWQGLCRRTPPLWRTAQRSSRSSPSTRSSDATSSPPQLPRTAMGGSTGQRCSRHRRSYRMRWTRSRPPRRLCHRSAPTSGCCCPSPRPPCSPASSLHSRRRDVAL